MASQKMKISDLADQMRAIPLRDVLERYGFEVRPEGTTLRARSEHHNIVVTGGRWFDNKAAVGGGGAIDLVIHLAGVNFSAACRSLAHEFIEAGQARLSFPKGLGNKLTAFAVGNVNEADRIVVVESPIDALSYYSLFGCRSGRLAVVSSAGATVPRELMLQAYDRCQAVVVALDNDPAGQQGRQKARDETLNWAGFKLSSDCPKLKDWNDDLVAVIQRMRAPRFKESAFLRL